MRPNELSGDIGIQATEYIQNAQNSLGTAGNILRPVASTKAYINVSTIGLELYLQRWNSNLSRWDTINDLGYSQNIYSNYVEMKTSINVLSGYYYRVFGVHYINHGGQTERMNSISNIVYVN